MKRFLQLFVTALLLMGGQTFAQNKHEYVDLGLPSGTLWATCNVGAKTPLETGDFFAWGETKTKAVYEWGTYKYAKGNPNTKKYDLTKYCNRSDLGNIDNLTKLQSGDDAATANWGSEWCMPTEKQWKELIDNTTRAYVRSLSDEERSGMLFIAKNGECLFLPTAGVRVKDSLMYDNYVSYWSGSVCLDSVLYAKIITMTTEGFKTDVPMPRRTGLAVRAVRVNGNKSLAQNKHECVDLGLPSGTLWATCNLGANKPLEYGDNIAWGETQPKTTYDWSTYKYYKVDGGFTKYCYDSALGDDGFADNLTQLQSGDDAATANWGSEWCMPTEKQWEELVDNTTSRIVITPNEGMAGKLFIAKNGKCLFLPVVEINLNSGEPEGDLHLYWSSSICLDTVFESMAFRPVLGRLDEKHRCRGLNVRPVRTYGAYNGHEYVDLGLPSGARWATCNVGASKPEEYGGYFAWGETWIKTTYDWSTYKYAYVHGVHQGLTKYLNGFKYDFKAFTDNLSILTRDDDAATAYWGYGWRIPTKGEWDELYQNTTHTWTTRNGVNGWLLTAKNGKSLFLPAAGGYGGNELDLVGSFGLYWSSLLCKSNPKHAWYLVFGSDSNGILHNDRFFGLSVRAVIGTN